MAIFFYCNFTNKKQWLNTIKKKFPNNKVYTIKDKPNFLKIKYAIIWNLPNNIMKKLKNVKIFFSLGAGVDHIINSPGYNKAPIVRVKDINMAERMSYHVHSQILTYQLKLYLFQKAQIQKIWLGEQNTKLNKDITIGIVGLGFLGHYVAKYLNNLNYNVIGLKRDNRKKVSNIKIFNEKNLKKFLNLSDIVVSILPDTEKTKNFINKNFLSLMKRDSFLINIGRGSTLNENDLLLHLNKNKNFFVSLDVFKIEPLPKNNKFWTHKNVIVTPHAAALTDIDSSIDLMVSRFKHYKKNGKIKSDVNLVKGY
tara:strand:- start:1458 stop:2387 length:930 start_codon:yes stop_codon:yes gene_type:complete